MTTSYDLVAGDTLSFFTSAPTGADVVYSPADGWTLKYRLIPRSSTAAVIDLTASTEGSGYRIAAIAADTASWTAGYYTAAAWVEKGAEKYTVEPLWDQVRVKDNPRTVAAGFDGRTQAQKALDDLNAALATYTASQGNVSEYEINGRRMKFRATVEITELITYWQAMRAGEIRADAIARGMADPRKVYVAFNRS